MQVRARGRRGAVPRRRQGSGQGAPLPKKLLLVLLMALLGLFAGLLLLDVRIKPVISTVGAARAKAVANTSIMRAVEAELKERGGEYEDLVSIRIGEAGEIRAVMSNIVKINRLKARISERVQENLNIDMIHVSIPLGNLVGGDLFSGRGPLIPFKLLPYGNVVVEVDNQFTSAGINQTLHRIVLTVDAGVSIVLPVSSVSTSVTTSVVVAETIIVGEVPERYASFDEGSGSATNALLAIDGA